MSPSVGGVMYAIAAKLPRQFTSAIQRIVGRNPRARQAVKRLTGPMRAGTHRISAGPAKGMLMDLAGSRPSYLLGASEPQVVRFLVERINPGDTVFDLGANVGYFTLIAAALTGPSGKVVAYEPLPANAAALRRNVALNALGQIEIVEAALSDEAGTATLAIGDDNQKASLVVGREAGEVIVPTVTLENEAGRVGAPHVIKSDVEGAEYDVFRAAGQLLARRPAILCEVHRVKEGDRERMVELFEEHSYQTEWIDDEGWTAHLVAT